MSNHWNYKLAALFHDPPDKQLGRQEHKKRAWELMGIAVGNDPEDALLKCADQADKIASAADRQEMLRNIRVDIMTHPTLTHMLSGRRVTLPHVEKANCDAQTSAVMKLVSGLADPKIKYLTLWRQLWEQIAQEDQTGLGRGWALLPAETRQPDHSLVTHLDVTAALATALPNPAFLMLSTGSVQPFIEASRRTQDLWMGSYLLSYLVWRGIQAVIKEVGPDAILYPSLRGHPLVDLWLKDQGVTLDKPPLEAFQQASFPDSFTALVPTEHAQTLAQRAEAAIWQARDEIAQAVRQEFPGLQQDATWREIWERQLRDWPPIYWVVYPWPSKDVVAGSPYEPIDKGTSWDAAHAQMIVDTYKKLTGADNDGWDEFFGKRFTFYWQARRHNLNSGTTYVLLHDLARRGLAARKATRDFEQVAEPGEKCTVCGEREVLHLQDGSRGALRAYWGSVAEDLQRQDRHAVIRPEGTERLCALCAIKRFAQRDYFEGNLGLKRPFPSTRHIAAATFWREVLQSEDDDLWQALMALNAALYAFQIPKTAAEDAIPFLTAQLREIRQQDRQRTAAHLLRYDAELLTPDAYQDRDTFFKDWGVDLEPQKLTELRHLSQMMLKAARKAGIMPPARYFAVLFFDGDHMGKWVSGELGPQLQEVLHPEAYRQLAEFLREEWAKWQELLEQKRLVSPAHHAAITQALATFAQRLVRMAVEEWYPGRLVYAGGDDVLALLPVADALQIARSLRFLFSGEVGRLTFHPGVEEISDDEGRASGFITLDGEWLATMGPTAAASAGMVIAHYQAPLGDVLRAVREAETDAKHSYGRNALAVRFLKRSGEPRHVGTKWFYEDFDPLATLIQTQQDFDRDLREQHKGISGKMPYTLRAEASTLSHLDREAIHAEIGRLLKRQSEIDDPEREKLATVFADWVKELHVYGCKGAEMVADWLILVRFLASGGGEE